MPMAARRRGTFVAPNLGVSQNTLFVLLCIASLACCVAMAMPQVHIVAYCGDLGYGVARGAEMLSLMLAFGLISRIGSGFIADRFGGVVTLLIGSVMQAAALFLYLWFDGLTSLYVISILFGLFQGGIVPSYAVIIRQYFPPQEAGYSRRHGDHGERGRHGARRLDVRLYLRSHRLVSRGVPERARLEPAQSRHRVLAAAGRPAGRANGDGVALSKSDRRAFSPNAGIAGRILPRASR